MSAEISLAPHFIGKICGDQKLTQTPTKKVEKDRTVNINNLVLRYGEYSYFIRRW